MTSGLAWTDFGARTSLDQNAAIEDVVSHIPEVQTTRIRLLPVAGVENTDSETPRYRRIGRPISVSGRSIRVQAPSPRRKGRVSMPPKCSIAISAVRLSTGRFVKGRVIFSPAARASLLIWNCQWFRTINASTITKPSARIRVGVSRNIGDTAAGPFSHRNPVVPSMIPW